MQLINKKKNYKFKPFNVLKFKYTRSYNKLQVLHFLVFLAGLRLKKLLTKYYLLLSTLILFPYIKSFLRNKYWFRQLKKRPDYYFWKREKKMTAQRRRRTIKGLRYLINLKKKKIKKKSTKKLKRLFCFYKYLTIYNSSTYIKRTRSFSRFFIQKKLKRQLIALRLAINLKNCILRLYKQIKKLTRMIFIFLRKRKRKTFFNQIKKDTLFVLQKKQKQVEIIITLNKFFYNKLFVMLSSNKTRLNSSFYLTFCGQRNNFYFSRLRSLHLFLENYKNNFKTEMQNRSANIMVYGKKKIPINLFLYYFNKFPSFLKMFYPLNYVTTYKRERTSIDFYLNKNAYRDLFIFAQFNFYNSLHKYKRIPERLRKWWYSLLSYPANKQNVRFYNRRIRKYLIFKNFRSFAFERMSFYYNNKNRALQKLYRGVLPIFLKTYRRCLYSINKKKNTKKYTKNKALRLKHYLALLCKKIYARHKIKKYRRKLKIKQIFFEKQIIIKNAVKKKKNKKK